MEGLEREEEEERAKLEAQLRKEAEERFKALDLKYLGKKRKLVEDLRENLAKKKKLHSEAEEERRRSHAEEQREIREAEEEVRKAEEKVQEEEAQVQDSDLPPPA